MIRIGAWLGIFCFLFCSCTDGEKQGSASSPRKKKNTRFDTPEYNQKFVRGEEIALGFTSTGATIDSVQLTLPGFKKTYLSPAFTVPLPNRKVGVWTLKARVFFAGKSESHTRKIIVLSENAPQEMTYKVEKVYPHDPGDFTQGLLIKDGVLYESTGQKGFSTFKKKSLATGETLQVVNLSKDVFGEGLAVVNDEFYQLTWTAGIGYVYNSDMEQIRTFRYSGQGYGMTTLGDKIVYTDETEKLYVVEPQGFTIENQLEAYSNVGKADSLNELETINGLIYANVWLTNTILAIQPETGEVVQKLDLSGLLSPQEAERADVLNGIAYDKDTEKIYVTGKFWPKLFEISIQPKNKTP